MKPTFVRRAAVATVAAVGIAGFSGAVASGQMEDAPVAVASAAPEDQPFPVGPAAYDFGETLSKLKDQPLEVTFMAAIIPHHRAAIEMAQLELERGVSPDIRTHAENIIASQQHQIDQFTRWLEEWYGLTPEEAARRAPKEARQEMAAMEQEAQRMIAELESQPEGLEFDLAFVQRMIPHHQAGIVEFLELQARAVHPQLRVAATAGITAQQAQAADFRTWFYGQLDSGSDGKS